MHDVEDFSVNQQFTRKWTKSQTKKHMIRATSGGDEVLLTLGSRELGLGAAWLGLALAAGHADTSRRGSA